MAFASIGKSERRISCACENIPTSFRSATDLVTGIAESRCPYAKMKAGPILKMLTVGTQLKTKERPPLRNKGRGTQERSRALGECTPRAGRYHTFVFLRGRTFLRSLSCSAIVLLARETFFALAASASRHVFQGIAQQKTASMVSGPSSGNLGVSFLNVARESGLNAKTIFWRRTQK